MSFANKMRLLAFGNPLVDITARVPRSLLQKYDVQEGSATLATPEQSNLFIEMSNRDDTEYCPGGAAQNTSRVA